MVEKFIADIPASIWAEGRPPRVKAWSSSFNVASWVKIGGAQGEIRLNILHQDDAGSHRTLVDKVNIKADGSSLLSSQVNLRFVGKVKDIKVTLELGDSAMRHLVEELYVQRSDSSQPQRKLIANF